MIILHKIKNSLRQAYNSKIARKLQDTNFSIISNTCLGGIMLHDFRQRFNSPFVNIYIKANDFIYLIQNFSMFANAELMYNQAESHKYNYPVGTIIINSKKINLYFLHDITFEQAKTNWVKRFPRINYSNLIFLLDDMGNELTENEFKNIKTFNKLFIFTRNINFKGKNVYHYKKNSWNYINRFSIH